MRAPLFSAADVAQLRDLAISALSVGAEGGSAWTVERPTGAGVAAKALVAMGSITALVFRAKLGTVAPNGADTPVLEEPWRLVVLAGTVQPGDVITSAADATYRFGVGSSERWYGYQRCELERKR